MISPFLRSNDIYNQKLEKPVVGKKAEPENEIKAVNLNLDLPVRKKLAAPSFNMRNLQARPIRRPVNKLVTPVDTNNLSMYIESIYLYDQKEMEKKSVGLLEVEIGKIRLENLEKN